MDNDVIANCLNLMRRMPPSNVENDMCGLLNLLPSEADELLQRIDQPLQEEVDPFNGRSYLLCDYNRDGDSYRSPWSNQYDPPIEDGEGFFPSDQLRKLEIQANEVFDSYRELYYQGGVSSVYMWDLEQGFAACFLIKKSVSDQKYVQKGSWNSIHVLEIKDLGKDQALYKLTTTMLLTMTVSRMELGDLNLSGSLTRQSEQTCSVSSPVSHIGNIGQLIENMENTLRSSMDNLYISKTREVINGIRHLTFGPVQGNAFVGELSGAVSRHGKNRTVDSEV